MDCRLDAARRLFSRGVNTLDGYPPVCYKLQGEDLCLAGPACIGETKCPNRACPGSRIARGWAAPMNRVLFGSESLDHLAFELDDMSVEEDVICVDGELETGFFAAHLPMFIAPEDLSAFLAGIKELDEKLCGSAALHASGPGNEIELSFEVLPLGHVRCSGKASINKNSLSFSFQTDQTQLGPLYKWFKAVMDRFRALRQGESAEPLSDPGWNGRVDDD